MFTVVQDCDVTLPTAASNATIIYDAMQILSCVVPCFRIHYTKYLYAHSEQVSVIVRTILSSMIDIDCTIPYISIYKQLLYCTKY